MPDTRTTTTSATTESLNFLVEVISPTHFSKETTTPSLSNTHKNNTTNDTTIHAVATHLHAFRGYFWENSLVQATTFNPHENDKISFYVILPLTLRRTALLEVSHNPTTPKKRKRYCFYYTNEILTIFPPTLNNNNKHETTTTKTPFFDTKQIKDNPANVLLEFHHHTALHTSPSSESEFRFGTFFFIPDLCNKRQIRLHATNNNSLTGNPEVLRQKIPPIYIIQVTLLTPISPTTFSTLSLQPNVHLSPSNLIPSSKTVGAWLQDAIHPLLLHSTTFQNLRTFLRSPNICLLYTHLPIMWKTIGSCVPPEVVLYMTLNAFIINGIPLKGIHTATTHSPAVHFYYSLLTLNTCFISPFSFLLRLLRLYYSMIKIPTEMDNDFPRLNNITTNKLLRVIRDILMGFTMCLTEV